MSERVSHPAPSMAEPMVDVRRSHGHELAYGLLLAMLLNFFQQGGHDRQRVIQVLFLLASGVVLAFLRTPLLAASRASLGAAIALTVFFLAGMVSSLGAFSPVHALYEVGSLLMLLLIALATAAAVSREPAALMRVLNLFAIIAAFYAVKIAVVYIAVCVVGAQPDVLVFVPGFANIRHFNHVETVGLPLLALVAVAAPARSPLRWVAFATAALWWAILFATAGRGTIVGLLAGSVLLLVLRRRVALPVLRAMLLGALGGTAIHVVFFVLAPQAMGLLPFGELAHVVARSLSDPASSREHLWKLAFELIGRHPWLGAGPLHFAHYGAGLRVGAHPHDWMLQIGAEWGIPALLALCVAIALGARGLLRAGRFLSPGDKANQDMLATWVLAGAAILVDGLVSGNIVMPQSQLMIVLYLACAAGWTWSLQPPSSAGVPSRRALLATATVVLAAMLCLALGAAPQFMSKLNDEEATATELQANGREVAWPRQWALGYF